ncbi:Replicative DNA helicase [Mycoplasmopsis maculosa]|uniref:Replicative DNA helicase n=1 Tax=Mycoplasmopsis maculosa TaxID=114885 RepID=A0A449B5A0_9BACT|nr:replicative DNA helicase [Mycoplasmopsis maculosa]VEU75784.1 Replicative DNA helicase [Mycoplasmopsis maculosa]
MDSKVNFSNKEMEISILGLVYIKNSNAQKIIPYLTKEDFSSTENASFFEIIKELFEKNITINREQVLNLAIRKKLNFINYDYLANLELNAGLSSNITFYLQELEKLTKLREISQKINKIQHTLNTNINVNDKEIISELHNLLLNIEVNKSDSDFLTSSQASDEFIEDLKIRRNLGKEGVTGVASGYKEIDESTQGFQGGELIILAARPAMGKTAFALNIANNAALSGKRVVFFTLEMPAKQLMGRLYGINSEIDMAKFKKPRELNEAELFKIMSVRETIINKLDLFIDESAKTDLSTLLWKCRRLHKIKPIDLIIIDYLQLLAVDATKPSRDRQVEVSTISRNLKTLALELKIPIISLSQLSREVEKREDKKPLLSDLRESGTIEQDADMVMFLFRKNYYQKKSQEEIQKEKEQFGDLGEFTDVIMAKHRNGPTGIYKLLFKMNCGKFEDIYHLYDKTLTEGMDD